MLQSDVGHVACERRHWFSGEEGRFAKATPAPTPKRCIHDERTEGAYHIHAVSALLTTNLPQPACMLRRTWLHEGPTRKSKRWLLIFHSYNGPTFKSRSIYVTLSSAPAHNQLRGALERRDPPTGAGHPHLPHPRLSAAPDGSALDGARQGVDQRPPLL